MVVFEWLPGHKHVSDRTSRVGTVTFLHNHYHVSHVAAKYVNTGYKLLPAPLSPKMGTLPTHPLLGKIICKAWVLSVAGWYSTGVSANTMLGLSVCCQRPRHQFLCTFQASDPLALLIPVWRDHSHHPSLLHGLQTTTSYKTGLADPSHRFVNVGAQDDPIKYLCRDIQIHLEAVRLRGGKYPTIGLEEICKSLHCPSKSLVHRLLPKKQREPMKYHGVHQNFENVGE